MTSPRWCFFAFLPHDLLSSHIYQFVLSQDLNEVTYFGRTSMYGTFVCGINKVTKAQCLGVVSDLRGIQSTPKMDDRARKMLSTPATIVLGMDIYQPHLFCSLCHRDSPKVDFKMHPNGHVICYYCRNVFGHVCGELFPLSINAKTFIYIDLYMTSKEEKLNYKSAIQRFI